MEPLSSRQKEWEMLAAILGREMTMAYLAPTDARQPRLAFHTEAHAAVATVKARIGLDRDHAGRGRQRGVSCPGRCSGWTTPPSSS